jgi:hypothetical protein
VFRPRHALKVVKDGVGKRTLVLIERMFQGRVQHVDAFELWVVPTTPADTEKRLLFVGRLADGDTVVLETTAELFHTACRELEEH